METDLIEREIAFEDGAFRVGAAVIRRPRSRSIFACFDIGIRNIGLRNVQPEPDVAVLPASLDTIYCERYRLVAEILSPSNTRCAIDLKLRRYSEAPDNLYAVMIELRAFLGQVIRTRSRNWHSVILARN